MQLRTTLLDAGTIANRKSNSEAGAEESVSCVYIASRVVAKQVGVVRVHAQRKPAAGAVPSPAECETHHHISVMYVP